MARWYAIAEPGKQGRYATVSEGSTSFLSDAMTAGREKRGRPRCFRARSFAFIGAKRQTLAKRVRQG